MTDSAPTTALITTPSPVPTQNKRNRLESALPSIHAAVVCEADLPVTSPKLEDLMKVLRWFTYRLKEKIDAYEL